LNSRVNFRRTACWLTLVGWALSSPVAAAADDLIERFATIETVWASRIAPDGKHVALGCSTPQGLRAACIYQLDAPGKKPIVYTSSPDQRIENLFWAGPDWLLLHVNRNDNVKATSDNISLLRLDRLLANNVRTGQSSILLEKDVPQVDLTDVAATPAGWSGEIVMRATSDYGLGAYRVDLATGRGKVLERYSPFTMHMLFDEAGAPVLELKYDRKQQRYVLMSRKDGVEHGIGEDEADVVSPLDWAGYIDGGNKLAGLGYADDGTVQPYVYDIATRTRTQADASLQKINVSGWISERTSDAVVGVYYTTDYPRQKFFDETLERARLAVAKALPDQTIYLTSWSADRSLITLWAAPPGASETHYLFDRKQGTLSPLGVARPLLSNLPGVTTTSIKYAARDGLTIEAFLTLPIGKVSSDGPFPLVLMPHGGPSDRDDASFDMLVNFLAHRGYAVLRPNFRGSAGYGLEFRKKGYGEFGGAMIDDIIDGTRFVIGGGIVDRNRICSMGGSYGGYAALMVALREPDLVKCVVSISGVTDPTALFGERLKLFDRDSSVMRFWENYIGSRFRDKEEIVAASPVRSAQRIPVPVLLLHGTDDVNVPVSQSRHLKKQLKNHDRPVKYVEIEGADHYMNTTDARRVLLTETDAFLAKYLSKK
jgi:dipeptidyl aminopeptidase/acylaminoacyl peptidase